MVASRVVLLSLLMFVLLSPNQPQPTSCHSVCSSQSNSMPNKCHNMKILTLHCWVHDEDVGRIFKVKISRTETVTALKGAIRNKNPVAFRNVDARDLTLYKVSFPDTDPQVEESLKKLLLDKQECLGA